MATTEPPPTESSDLQDLVGPVWRRRWLLLAIIVLSTVGTYLVASRRPSRYQSSTQVFVGGSPIQAIVNGGQAPGTDRSTLDEATILRSLPVTQAVLKRLHLSEPPQALMGSVTATPITGSNFVVVTADRRSAQQAADVANAYVQEYLHYRNSQLVASAVKTIGQLQTQLRTLPARPANQQARQSIQDTIRQLQVVESSGPSQASQTEPAVAPSAPYTPVPKRDAAFALAIALGLGLALAFGLERFDRRIRKVEEVTRVYGLPLLAVIPHDAAPVSVREGKAETPASLREPFRSLRTNLGLASLDEPLKRIVVASAVAGEGKSTVVTNLALTYRDWGLSVVVVEADLRRPTLGVSLGLEPSPGLTAVLTGDCDLDDALMDIEVDTASQDFLDKVPPAGEADSRRLSIAATASSSKLVLLPSGHTPPNPPAVLASDRMVQVIEDLAVRFDIVLLDTPPLLAVSDAIPLLARADGVILVTRVGLTERGAAQRAVAAAKLDSTARILGVVANDVAYQPGSGYGYGYGYGYG